MGNSLKPIDLNKIELFAAQYVPHFFYKKVAPFHREIFSALADRDVKYLAIEAMRGSGKTTIGSVLFALYEICEGTDDAIQIVSRSGGAVGTSTKIAAKVKKELETNQLLIHDYGIKKGTKWGEEHIQVTRGDGHTIDFYSLGKRSSIRGARGTVLIDDPQNSDDCKSETVVERDEDWFLTDVIPVIIDNQRLIFIGTPISPLSLLEKVKKLPGFKTLSFPAEDPPHSGRSVWVERYTDADLTQLRAMLGVDRYAAEYLCEPRVSGNPVYRREWFLGYDPESEVFKKIKRDGFYIVSGMDTAESKAEQADYTAIVTWGVTGGAKPDIYCLDVRRGHWTTKEGAEQLFLVFNQFKQHKSVVESRVKAGDAMIEEIRERERIYAVNVNVYPVKPIKDKVIRAHRCQSFFQEGRIYFNLKDKNQQAYINELTMFTGSQAFHDDMVDAGNHGLADVKEREMGAMGQPIASAIGEEW